MTLNGRETMNVENLDRLIAAIEAAPPEQFNMNSYLQGVILEGEDREALLSMAAPPCGSACCFAGWAWFLTPTHQRRWGTSAKLPDYRGVGQEFLGLNKVDADELFMPGCVYWTDITKAKGLSVLRKLRATGVVDWSEVDA